MSNARTSRPETAANTSASRRPIAVKMLTVVLKQDLWWPRREEVRAWYEEGEYAKILEAIERTRGV